MAMDELLAKLNRMRVNAGKPELKSWKGSRSKINELIDGFEAQGITDALPGANVNAQPITNDPEVAKALPKDEPAEKKEPTVTKVKASLARGLDGVKEATHSRKAVQDIRRKEKADLKLSKEDKQQIADEAEARSRPKGEVDPKKDPEKAARQKKHIEDKQKARAEKNKANGRNPANDRLKAPGDDEVTVAEIARELDIDPKVARAKLRRHESKLEALHTKGQDRWTFPKSAKKTIMEILK